MATSRIADSVGRVLGDRYRLTRPLGVGASAHVYVAEDVTLRRRVAIKVLHPALAGDEAFLRRFQAEARVVAALRHPNILRVYDWGEDDGAPYLVMELLEGGSLRALLDRGHLLSPAQAAAVGADVARALDYAHRRGLVHRDIKPANLIFDDEGRLSVADFGLARALAEATWTEPAGAVVGTARYAAPEAGPGGVARRPGRRVRPGPGPGGGDDRRGPVRRRHHPRHPDGPPRPPGQVPGGLGPLGPVLESAGTVDPADRLDAVGLARALDAVVAALPPRPPAPAGPCHDRAANRGSTPPRPITRDGPVCLTAACDESASSESARGWPRGDSLDGRASRRRPGEGWSRPETCWRLRPTTRLPTLATGDRGCARARPTARRTTASGGPRQPRRGAAERASRPPRPPLGRGAGAANPRAGGPIVLSPGGTVLAVLRATGALTPSHPVPNLIGSSQAAAQRTRGHFTCTWRWPEPAYDAHGRRRHRHQPAPGSGGRLKEGEQRRRHPLPRAAARRRSRTSRSDSRRASTLLTYLGLKPERVGTGQHDGARRGRSSAATPPSGTLLPGQTVTWWCRRGSRPWPCPPLQGPRRLVCGRQAGPRARTGWARDRGRQRSVRHVSRPVQRR